MTKMKLLYIPFIAAGLLATGCIEEIDPLTSYVTQDQLDNAPDASAKLATAITSTLVGQCLYASYTYNYAWDFGMPAQFIMRDSQGQDMANVDNDSNWFSTWEYCGTGLGPGYAVCQIPWTYYYGWIKNCNNVLTVTGDEPTDADDKIYAGLAHAMRAYYYMDLAQMFAPETYSINPDALTVPIITQHTTIEESTNNPRATNTVMWDFILQDLNWAESQLADYTRTDKTTPDLNVIYGLKARAYLIMNDWVNAEKYAKDAKAGYSALTNEQYNDRTTGFNSPDNSSWMMCMTYKADDRNITWNDGDCSWGTWMITEMTEACGMGYASNYGVPFVIDRHLYETIPYSDARKDTFVDFKVQEDLNAAYATGDDDVIAAAEDAAIEYVREHNSDYPEGVVFKNLAAYEQGCGGLPVKFRPAGGTAGYNNQNIGYVVSVPMMRVEEMMLIEAEAAGMQSEARGIELLTDFATLRDPDYEYGTHNEAYNSSYATAFQNEVWWQRRVEFWGEGLATFDIKRLNKGIIRSYANTNHPITCRWNTNTVPQWMIWCIIGTETDYNIALSGKNNPTPIRPAGDSPEFVFGN